jgi:hypothetical protein
MVIGLGLFGKCCVWTYASSSIDAKTYHSMFPQWFQNSKRWSKNKIFLHKEFVHLFIILFRSHLGAAVWVTINYFVIYWWKTKVRNSQPSWKHRIFFNIMKVSERSISFFTGNFKPLKLMTLPWTYMSPECLEGELWAKL